MTTDRRDHFAEELEKTFTAGTRKARPVCAGCGRPTPARRLVETRRGAACPKCLDHLPAGVRRPAVVGASR